MDKGTIVVIEDEAAIADLVGMYLEREGFRVLKCATGESGVDAFRQHRPRLMVLDVGLPDVDGLEVCKKIRQTSQIPIIFLTARDGEVDRVLGLELGADDYITKPFSPAELVARVKAVLRRTDGAAPPEVVQAGRVAIDGGRREVRIDDEPVELTTKEFDLLRFFAERPGLALSRKQILDGVWGYDWYGDPRTVDVHIAQVRKKVGNAVEIRTVRGIGYRLEASAREAGIPPSSSPGAERPGAEGTKSGNVEASAREAGIPPSSSPGAERPGAEGTKSGNVEAKAADRTG
ncbi:MAG: response regulator transcription factor [Actinobacteria bacterium]|nr:MAG: response regulator transcription factor [Actinomycetota bacterium]